MKTDTMWKAGVLLVMTLMCIGAALAIRNLTGESETKVTYYSSNPEVSVRSEKEVPKYQEYKLIGTICAWKNGEPLGCKDNVGTDDGRELIEDYMQGGNFAAVNDIALGNTSTPTTSSTSHPGEITDCGLARASASTTYDNGIGNWTVEYVWNSITCDGVLVNTTGVYNQTSGGTYVCGGALATGATVSTPDTLTLNYTLAITAS